MEILLFTLIIIESVIIILLLTSRFREQKQIQIISKNAGSISKKDFNGKDICIPDNSAFAKLAKYINTTKTNFLFFIESTKGNLIVLSDAIDALVKSARANEQGSEQTSKSIAIVAEKASEQLALVRDNLSLIESNNEQLNEIDNHLKSIVTSLNQSATHCQEGIVTLEEYEKSMSIISSNLHTCTDILTDFNKQIVQINSIGELVMDINEQLKLLSLNASIEAARAGEAGKGFAVVSREMSVMSESTMENMTAINEILEQITQSSEVVTKSIHECDIAFKNSSDVFGQLSAGFRSIDTKSIEINKKMSDVMDKYHVIAQNSNISRTKAENIFEASQTISDSTQDISSVSQETAVESMTISDNVKSLEKLLSSIQSVLSQFHTELQPVAESPSRRIKIAFFSMLDNFFWYSVKRGVNYAQKVLADRNADIVYYSYENSEAEKAFPDDVQRCIDEQFDAIIYPGFIQGADDRLKKAVTSGIKLFTYNCDSDPSIKRVCCYSPDEKESGILAAREIQKVIGGKGNIVIMSGEQTVTVNKQRYDSFTNYINTHCKGINIVDTFVVYNRPEETYNKIVNCLKNHPDIKAIFSTTGMQLQLAKAIVDTGNTGKVKAVVFDHNDEIFEYIKKGVIAAAIDYEPFSQGYEPIILMYNHLVAGYRLDPTEIKCKSSIVTEANVNDLVKI